MLAIVALALLAHIGPTTRPRRDNRPPGEYVIRRDRSVGSRRRRSPGSMTRDEESGGPSAHARSRTREAASRALAGPEAAVSDAACSRKCLIVWSSSLL